MTAALATFGLSCVGVALFPALAGVMHELAADTRRRTAEAGALADALRGLKAEMDALRGEA